MKNDIKNRDDIFSLVNAFYKKVRKDELLGVIFNSQIHDWDEHLEHITDFWQTNLLAIKAYKGDPFAKHIKVDEKSDYQVTNEHFGAWLRLWMNTIDELFEGEKATLAKHRARKMGTFMFIKIFENKPKK